MPTINLASQEYVDSTAVAKNGDTMTGPLTVKRENFPKVHLQKTSTGAIGKYEISDNDDLVLMTTNTDESNFARLYLRQNFSNVADIIAVGDESNSYKLYGEHNKPTASDVGAVPVSGGNLTGSLNFTNTNDYFALSKTRNINNVPHKLTLGVAAGGATTLEHYTNSTLDNRLELSLGGLKLTNGMLFMPDDAGIILGDDGTNDPYIYKSNNDIWFRFTDLSGNTNYNSLGNMTAFKTTDLRTALSNLKIQPPTDTLKDCNKPPAMFCYLNGYDSTITNKPFSDGAGILITTWRYSESTGNGQASHITQMAVHCGTGKIYTRFYDDSISGMSTWKTNS